MKLFNVITFCCAIFAGSAIADNKLPDWLSTSKKDYDLVRAFYLSGFASKAMNNQFGYHLPSELVMILKIMNLLLRKNGTQFQLCMVK